jgi:hypothetical protein
MTETEWLACTDPTPMLAWLSDKASSRKLMLFSCGCHYRVWRHLPDDGTREVIQHAERFADGLIGYDELNAAYTRRLRRSRGL